MIDINILKNKRLFFKITILSFIFVLFFNLIIPVKADMNSTKRLFDDAGFFNTDEYNNINSLLLETEATTGFVVSLVTTNDVGSDKSDTGVQDYADLYYERYFGINTDGIIFVINNDTKYDYISTSGICERYFDLDRIDEIFDRVWNSLVDGEYNKVVEIYCERVLRYYNTGVVNYTYDDGYNYNEYHSNERTTEKNILIGVVVGFAVSVIVAVSIILTVKNRYKIKPVKNAYNYLNNSSVKYYQKSDTFIKQYTTKRKIETDSNHGSGSGGGGHFSSGGGHHGGGGRHR